MLRRCLSFCLLSVLALSLSAVPASFYLVYEARGSEYPVTIRISLNGKGQYRKTLRCPAYAGSPSRAEEVTGTLPDAAFSAFVKELVEKRGFFTLPETFTHALKKMDMATQYLTLSLDGRYRRIGGYDAGSHPGSKGVFQLVDALEKQLVNKQTKKIPG